MPALNKPLCNGAVLEEKQLPADWSSAEDISQQISKQTARSKWPRQNRNLVERGDLVFVAEVGALFHFAQLAEPGTDASSLHISLDLKRLLLH